MVPLAVSLDEVDVCGVAYIYEPDGFMIGSFEPVRFRFVYLSGYLFRGSIY
jgi:hypothetical protein